MTVSRALAEDKLLLQRMMECYGYDLSAVDGSAILHGGGAHCVSTLNYTVHRVASSG
jgi:hypothetical protein